jgi:hypothetical protein
MSLSSTDISDGDGAIGKLTADLDEVVIAVNTPVAAAAAVDSVLVEESQSPSNPSDAHSTRAQLNQMAEILSNEVDSKLMNPTSRGDAVATVTRGAPTVASIDGPSSSDEKAPNLKNMSDAEVSLPICLSIICDTDVPTRSVTVQLSLLSLCECRFTSTLTSKPRRSSRRG